MKEIKFQWKEMERNLREKGKCVVFSLIYENEKSENLFFSMENQGKT